MIARTEGVSGDTSGGSSSYIYFTTTIHKVTFSLQCKMYDSDSYNISRDKLGGEARKIPQPH
jgi:hypothetical protein